MANAAEKKAAAARGSAKSFYLPVVLIINVVYILIRVICQRESFTRNQALLTTILWALTAFAYNGIIEDHVNSASSPKKTGKSSGSDPIAGGASLDLLGLVVVSQFGGCLISEKFYWLICVLPFWGAWMGYQIIYGGKNKGLADGFPSVTAEKPEEVDEKTAERRRQRAERRRMKGGR
uniref:Transmembrane protein 208 n=1 Tax=Odontella aurita TaxID=265563 RepID=A0A7S4JX31_9STRA|mmetsp:Transcript_56073/g.167826  ORF Transcript_56073/g.167826 Transcript_56073/m.167826 type:complete len:178 (+) Transcript_56073:81-614(+)